MQGDVTASLTRAFFEEWARVGYAALSLERVAKNAGTGKAALYRRWSSKVVMANDLLSKVGLSLTDDSDTGSLEADLIAFLYSLRHVLRHRTIRRILLDLHAETGRETGLKIALQRFQEATRERVKILIDRAVGRGELPMTVDRDAAGDLVVSALYWRLAVIGGRSDRRHLETIARMAVAAITVSGTPF